MADEGPWTKYQAAPAAEGPWTQYQPDPHAGMSHTRQATPHEPDTTAAGVAGAIERGIAPVATGAAVGAGLGSLGFGVGAVPGAIAGAGAAGMTQLVTELYKPLAKHFGWGEAATPQEAAGKVLDAFGVKRPSNAVEKTVEATAGGAAGAIGGAGMANQLALRATSPVTRAVAGKLAEKPMLQALSGASGGASGQIAANMGAGPAGQTAASFLGSLMPYGARASVSINPKQAAKTAIDAGYVLPPAEATQGSIGGASVPNVLAGFSGKVKNRQYASATNQPVTNSLRNSDLGVPPDVSMTPAKFESVRAEAGKAYGVLKAVPNIALDDEYRTAISSISAEARAAAKEFPKIIDVSEIESIQKELMDKPVRSTSGLVEVVKRLRFDAKANLQARDAPNKLALGLAQRQAAWVVEDLIERRLAETGRSELVDQYRAARTLIAKSYDWESATNASTGNTDARHIAALFDKGRPMTGNMKIVADAANNFPHAFQPEAKIGGVETWSVLDMAYAAAAASAAAARGDVGLAAILAAAVPFARPAVRAGVLSRPFQRTMISNSPASAILPLMTQPGQWAVTQPAQVGNALGVPLNGP